jgi:hypothetical protein
LNATLHECQCDPGWQGYNCEIECPASETGALDIAIVMDVSGTLANNPDKDAQTADFFNSLLGQFDTTTQVKLSISSFSDESTTNLPMGHYNTEEVYNAVDSIDWVGGLTNMKAGLEAGASTIDTTDNITDVILIISDGFDSFNSQEVLDTALEITNEGTAIITVAFGGDTGFVNQWQMLQIANMINSNFFAASDGDALMEEVDPILAQMCAQTGQRALFNREEFSNPVQERWYLYKAISERIDKTGEPPRWAAAIMNDPRKLPKWAKKFLKEKSLMENS